MPGSPLDLASLRPILDEGPVPLFATVSGAHLYGFASEDSDVDPRGACSASNMRCQAPYVWIFGHDSGWSAYPGPS